MEESINLFFEEVMKEYTFVDYLIEKEKKQRDFFENYLKYAKEMKKIANKFFGKARTIIFGSILEKGKLPEDIDILVVSPEFSDFQKRRDFLVKMKHKFGSFCPFEFHLVTPQDYQEWYKNFIKRKKEV